MRELRLFAAVVLLVGVAACGPKKPTKQADDDFKDDVAETPDEVAWPTRQRACGDSGNWCGPYKQVQAVAPKPSDDSGGAEEEDDEIRVYGQDAEEEASPDPEEITCPDEFYREPHVFTLDVEETATSMSGNCCYSYHDDSCRQP